jgi:hypothetical protein
MKKLVGVMILSGFPVACGSTLPSGPDALQTVATSQDATVESQAAGRRPAPVPAPTPTPVPSCDADGNDVNVGIEDIHITILSENRGQVTLRADALANDSDRLQGCFVPTWSVDTDDSGVTLTTARDPQIATLSAPAGRYTVEARVNTGGRRGPATQALG